MITESDLQFKTKEEVAEIILAMQKIIAEKDKAILEKDTVIADKNKTIEYLYEQFRLSRYKRFGSKSEKDTGGAHQLSLFDEAVTPDNTPEIVEADEELTIPEHTRKKKGRKSLPKNLPRKQEIYDLPEAEKTCACGCALTYIGDEVSEQLEIIPLKVYIIEHVRKKYACRGCEETLKQAPMPKQPIPKSIAAPGLLAHTLVSKFEDHLPLYRQEHILQRVGVDIPRATLSPEQLYPIGLSSVHSYYRH